MPATSPVGRRRRDEVSPIKNYNIVKDQKVYSAQINVNQAFKAGNYKLDHKVHFAKHYALNNKHNIMHNMHLQLDAESQQSKLRRIQIIF